MEHSEPKFEEIPGGFRVTCPCGNQVEVRVSPPRPQTKQFLPWLNVALVCLGSVAVGQAIGLIAKWVPPWLFIPATCIGAAWMVVWMVRLHRSTERDLEEHKKFMAEAANRNNARWQ